MKKLLAFISIIVVCVTISTCSLAATSLKDVKGTKYEDAVNALIEVGLVNGYPEDNTYRPNVVVTRAQMSKMMVIALGEESKVTAAAKKKSAFTDLKENHWAYGYINVAKDLGIVVGQPDGSFAPDSTVTYAQATTMVIRALGYEDEVTKSSTDWPSNYINYAKKLNLYNSIGTFKNDNGATRGDVANLLWNMLRTGVCTVIGQTTNGGLTYGQGQKMINKYKNYTYLENAKITSVDFNDTYTKATVRLEDAKDRLTVTFTDKEVLEYYGRKLDVLYNDKTKSIFSIDSEKEYKEVKGSITKIKSNKIYFDDDYYTLPDDDNILLYKVDKLSNAIDATLYMSGSTVKYVLATGAKEVKLALVTDNDLTIDSSKDGIKVKAVGSSKKSSYILIDKSDMPEEGSMILYYLNSDDELGIIKEIKLDSASSINSLTSSKIKIGSKTYTYDSETFEVVSVISSSVSTLKFKNIDKSKDMVYAYEYSGITYLIVFEDAVENETNVATAKKDLENYVKSVDGKYPEANYSQSTWYNYNSALTSAKTLLNSSSPKASRLTSALANLKTAVSELKSVSKYTTEGKIAQHRANIRKLINVDAANIVKDKSKYTTASYNSFSSALDKAKKLLERTDNTVSEAENVYEDLNNAITTGMKLVKDTQEHKDAVILLNKAIVDAKAKVGDNTSDDYVKSTWDDYKTALDNANKISTSSGNYSILDVNKATEALNVATDKLELAVESLKDELNALIVKCRIIEESKSNYMKSTYDAFESALTTAYLVASQENPATKEVKDALDGLKKAKGNLVEIETVLENTMNAVKDIVGYAENIKDAYNMSVTNADDKLKKIANIKKAVEIALESAVESARQKIAEPNFSGDGSLETAMGKAKAVLSGDKDLNKLVAAYKDLYVILNKND